MLKLHSVDQIQAGLKVEGMQGNLVPLITFTAL
jgi:hypothetical protein